MTAPWGSPSRKKGSGSFPQKFVFIHREQLLPGFSLAPPPAPLSTSGRTRLFSSLGAAACDPLLLRYDPGPGGIPGGAGHVQPRSQPDRADPLLRAGRQRSLLGEGSTARRGTRRSGPEIPPGPFLLRPAGKD